jgi:hypothetical protein
VPTEPSILGSACEGGLALWLRTKEFGGGLGEESEAAYALEEAEAYGDICTGRKGVI